MLVVALASGTNSTEFPLNQDLKDLLFLELHLNSEPIRLFRDKIKTKNYLLHQKKTKKKSITTFCRLLCLRKCQPTHRNYDPSFQVQFKERIQTTWEEIRLFFNKHQRNWAAWVVVVGYSHATAYLYQIERRSVLEPLNRVQNQKLTQLGHQDGSDISKKREYFSDQY